MSTIKYDLYPMLDLDFEFNQITSEKVNLVSCVTFDEITGKTRRFWLHNNPNEVKNLVKHLNNYQYLFGWACVAESRAFISAGLDPLKFQWMDGFLEYRMLSNHNDELNWGEQLVDGVVKTVRKPRPKWEREEGEASSGFKPTHSLAEATFKLTNQIRDTKEKDETRALIISNPKSFTSAQRERILEYNADDVKFLRTIRRKLMEKYAKLVKNVDWERYFEESFWRGRYAAHTALMESHGYPINYEATRNFSKQIPAIMSKLQRDINSQFPDIKPFKWNKREATFAWNQKVTRQWIIDNKYEDRWIMTKKSKKFPKGQLGLSLEAFQKFFDYKHDYPRFNFGAQIVRFLKMKQSLYGFSEKKKTQSKVSLTNPFNKKEKKTFWDSVGPDKRVRPYMNIYGAQSSRSQPAATGFMFLKPAWMRALVQPAKGYYIAGVDYGQQEFFLSALLSEDKNMIKAYLSGDPYLFMAKKAGMIPESGTKDSHPRERDLMKATTLGISYMMSKYGLSAKLTADTGKPFSEEEAQDLINLFNNIYPDFTQWRQAEIEHYEQMGEPISLWDGWTVWPDNPNPRSVGNVGVQGAGAVIMRRAVNGAVERGVKVIFTLHDAIYIEAKVGQENHIKILMDEMRMAFEYYFEGTKYGKLASKIKMDPKAWGPHWNHPKVVEKNGKKKEVYDTITVEGVEVPVSKLHIDLRSKSDYEKFSQYFKPSKADLL